MYIFFFGGGGGGGGKIVKKLCPFVWLKKHFHQNDYLKIFQSHSRDSIGEYQSVV